MLRKFRSRKYKSRRAFAKIINYSVTQIGRWERGEELPHRAVHLLLADALEVSGPEREAFDTLHDEAAAEKAAAEAQTNERDELQLVTAAGPVSDTVGQDESAREPGADTASAAGGTARIGESATRKEQLPAVIERRSLVLVPDQYASSTRRDRPIRWYVAAAITLGAGLVAWLVLRPGSTPGHPSVAVQGQVTVKITPRTDVYAPTTPKVLPAQSFLTVGTDCCSAWRTYIYVDPGTKIPRGAHATSATLYVYRYTCKDAVQPHLPCPPHSATELRAIRGAWTSRTDGGRLAALAGSHVVATYPATKDAKPTWFHFNITSLFQQWVNRQLPNYGIVLKHAEERRAVGQEYFSSDKQRNPPYLLVTYQVRKANLSAIGDQRSLKGRLYTLTSGELRRME